ncbi:MAG: hypothetical protein JWO42_2581 [Chloroflexi bacterium]|nr:hypothetical protein [Chloroflexota bacterium]
MTDQRLCQVARNAASAAALAVQANSAPEQYTGTINAGGDRVLAIDLAANEAARARIALEMGDTGYSVLSEESGLTAHGADFPLFLLDPVDGSAQARRRHPDCAVSIAVATGPLLRDIVAGVVQPLWGGEPYTAIRGQGAFLGQVRLPLTPTPSGPATSILVEGYNAPAAARLATRFAAHDPACQIHISGSIALQLALLAAGCYDVLIAARPGASAHDISAGWLLVLEAGAIYADFGGLDTASAQLLDSIKHHPAGARRGDLLESARLVALG